MAVNIVSSAKSNNCFLQFTRRSYKTFDKFCFVNLQHRKWDLAVLFLFTLHKKRSIRCAMLFIRLVLLSEEDSAGIF